MIGLTEDYTNNWTKQIFVCYWNNKTNFYYIYDFTVGSRITFYSIIWTLNIDQNVFILFINDNNIKIQSL